MTTCLQAAFSGLRPDWKYLLHVTGTCTCKSTVDRLDRSESNFIWKPIGVDVSAVDPLETEETPAKQRSCTGLTRLQPQFLEHLRSRQPPDTTEVYRGLQGSRYSRMFRAKHSLEHFHSFLPFLV
jgi:hypothetical protein